MSAITTLLRSLFGKNRGYLKLFLVGLDWSGRTTLLYRLALGKTVPTIPTIGFNVEEVRHNNSKCIIWDVGGCDKIRHLWRHYVQDCDGIVFFVDSTDRTRIEEARDEFQRFVSTDEVNGVPIVVFANKQDRPGCMGGDTIRQKMGLHTIRGSPSTFIAGSALSDETGQEILDWIVEAQKSRPEIHPKDEQGKDEQPTKLEQWLQIDDEPDDEFVKKLENYTLESWDHRTHLRIAWLFLKRHGRRQGMALIFDRIKKFIQNSSRTNRSQGTTFHESLTYFWVHMVHYAMESTANPTGDFKTFLVLNPLLSNGGLFLDYYTKALLMENPAAREKVVLPDKKPLPSLISDVSKPMNSEPPGSATRDVETDEEFLTKFENGEMTKWNHDCMLRIVWIYLKQLGRKQAVDVILDQMKRHEGHETFHFTITYFWIHMVSWISALDSKQGSFEEFANGDGCGQELFREFAKEKTHYLKYYKHETIFSKAAQQGLVLPDKKQLPNVIR